ncbi:hypothetical protein CSAL01_00417 [Colletotrichum salicis]|uniref:Uncharacterized protein n=1 Tax=Colletotrichum salicis TaxID=1209931 RepID=A0A135SG11_9PEZI|nr:hypothetical protein CSAL01_00417 [Colletotrichum salicis]
MEDSASVNCRTTNVSSSPSDDHHNDTADSLISDCGPGKKDEIALVEGNGIRRRDSASATQQFLLDILTIIPSICFIVYGVIALKDNHRPIKENPVPALRMAATYSPTVFPIVYAAVTANLLKAAAGWKMERGVTVLSLEYLLSCPLWAMSLLGGQAALRIIDVVSSQASGLYPFECLEFMSIFPHSESQSSAGYSILPSIQGAFISALSSPKDIKGGPRDAFGNVKIPMLEYYRQTSTIKPDTGGWYDVNPNDDDNIWSEIIGIPIATQGGFSQGQNYSFTLRTAYMSADCSVQRGESMTYGMWEGYHKIAPAGVFDLFMQTLIRVTLTTWEAERAALYKLFPSPLETYFTYPDAPFSAPGIGSWDGTDIYQVGNEVFSQRFSQLLNPFWLASVSSRNITGDFNFRAHTLHREIDSTLVQDITASGIAAGIFSCLRRGPDVLDRATFFLGDNTHVKVSQESSLEDGTSQVKSIKGVRVCISDVRPLEETVYVAFGTVEEAMPLRWQEKERRYV